MSFFSPIEFTTFHLFGINILFVFSKILNHIPEIIGMQSFSVRNLGCLFVPLYRWFEMFPMTHWQWEHVYQNWGHVFGNLFLWNGVALLKFVRKMIEVSLLSKYQRCLLNSSWNVGFSRLINPNAVDSFECIHMREQSHYIYISAVIIFVLYKGTHERIERL